MMSQPTSPEAPASEPQPPAFPADYSAMASAYANFCRVNVTPEELVLDFGLNTHLTPNPGQPVKIAQRVVMNFYTAKRLLTALVGVVGQHEAVYGSLELDLMRRIKVAPSPAMTTVPGPDLHAVIGQPVGVEG